MRIETFTFRVNTAERQMITKLAERFERNESDTVRLILRERARELGIAPFATKDDRHVAQPAT